MGAGGQAPASQVWQNLKVPTPSDPQRGPRAFIANVVPVSVQSWTKEPGWGLSPASLCTLQAGPVGTLRKRLGGTCPYSLPEEVTLTHMKPSNRNIRRYLDHVDHVKM